MRGEAWHWISETTRSLQFPTAPMVVKEGTNAKATGSHDLMEEKPSQAIFNLNSAVGAKQRSGKLLMLNQCLCLESSTMANPFGEAR